MPYRGAEKFLFMPDSGELRLAQCEGRVVPYRNDMQVAFEKPLIKTESETGIRAFSSGKRSALLKVGGSWYKIKGVSPTDKPFEGLDTPVGGQKADAVNRELHAASAIAKYGSKHGIPASLEPVCTFDYDMMFRGNEICASVLKARGDIRLTDIYPRFMDVLVGLRRKGVRESEDLREMVNRIGEFLGFWYRGFEEAGLCWGTLFPEDVEMGRHAFRSSAGMHNIAFYRMPGGIGSGFVDLAKSCARTDRKVDLELGRIRYGLKALEGGLYFLENGKDERSIGYWIADNMWKTLAPKSIFVKGANPYNGVPEPENFEVLRRFESCRKGSLPRPIDEKTFYTAMGAVTD